jgi:hypothetical protein
MYSNTDIWNCAEYNAVDSIIHVLYRIVLSEQLKQLETYWCKLIHCMKWNDMTWLWHDMENIILLMISAEAYMKWSEMRIMLYCGDIVSSCCSLRSSLDRSIVFLYGSILHILSYVIHRRWNRMWYCLQLILILHLVTSVVEYPPPVFTWCDFWITRFVGTVLMEANDLDNEIHCQSI